MIQCETQIQQFITLEKEEEVKYERKSKEEAQQLSLEFKKNADAHMRLVEEKEKEIDQARKEKEILMQQFIESQIAKQNIEMQAATAKLQEDLKRGLASQQNDDDEDDCFFNFKIGPLNVKI